MVSGIVLPEGTIYHAALGEVLATGPGSFTRDGDRIPVEVEAGQYIRYADAISSKINDLNGQELHLVLVSNIYGVVPVEVARKLGVGVSIELN